MGRSYQEINKIDTPVQNGSAMGVVSPEAGYRTGVSKRCVGDQGFT